MSRISNQHKLSFEPWLDWWPIEKFPELEILGHTANICKKNIRHICVATCLTCTSLALGDGSLYTCPLIRQDLHQRSTLLK
jgi:hypothetical protein